MELVNIIVSMKTIGHLIGMFVCVPCMYVCMCMCVYVYVYMLCICTYVTAFRKIGHNAGVKKNLKFYLQVL